MIADAGANGCKPVDRRTKYVNVNAISGEEDPNGVLNSHFQAIYTISHATRRQYVEEHEAILHYYLNPEYAERKGNCPNWTHSDYLRNQRAFF